MSVAKKKVIIYARVSSKEQEREGNSIPAQVSLLKEYAQNNNYSIFKIFKEAETAKKTGRKQFQAMIELIVTNSDVKTILVEKTDRLYRNLKDYVDLDFEQLGVEVHYVKENEILSVTSHSSKKFMHGIKVLMAKNYIDNLSEEVLKGHKEKLKKGVWPSKAPIGYKNKLEDHSIVIEREKAIVIKKAFEMAATGNYSIRLLKNELYEVGLRGPRSGKELSKSAMSRIIQNPFYYGEFNWKGRIYKGSHKPIISRDIFNKVQEVMGLTSKPSASKKNFVFRGPLTCGHCGSQITAEEKRKKSGKTYIYYHCTNGKGICENVVYLREEKIEEHYISALKKIQIPKDIVEFTREALLESHKEEKEFREIQLSELNKRYDKLESYIDQAYTDKLDGLIEPDKWTSKTAEWKLEQENIVKRLDALREANTAYMLEGIKLMEVANSAASLFEFMTKEEKRKIVNLVLSNPKIINGSIEYCYEKPFDMFVGVTQKEKWRE